MKLDDLLKTKVGQLPGNRERLESYRLWTPEEVAILETAYSNPNIPVDAERIAELLRRTKIAVQLKASELGLADRSRPSTEEGQAANTASVKQAWAAMTPEERSQRTSHLIKDGSYWTGKHHSEETKERCSQQSKAWHSKNLHPKGMKGKHLSDESKSKISQALAGRKVPRSQVLQMLKTRLANRNSPGFNPRPNASWKSGWLTVGGQRNYFRSTWEARYAQMLELLKRGKVIVSWEYEAETFWFPVPKGKNNYTPDFKITYPDGRIEFHEVKGWMDKRSRTVLARMVRFHPKVKLIIRDGKFFKRNRLASGKPIEFEPKEPS